jgi:undecaprenyl-diphosphatase
MSDASLFLFINGLAGKIPVIDEFFKGISNDYFSIIAACLVFIWLWFATRNAIQRDKNQRAVIAAAISIGFASIFIAICDHFHFRARPFNELPGGSVNLLFYKPTDSSFPSNFAAVIFAMATPIFIKNKRFGSFLLFLALLSSFGRVFIGVHYPLDVIAGAALGILAGFLSLGVSRVLKPVLDFMFILFRKICLA